MADKQEFIDRLNAALSWELAGVIQYMQHSVMVAGPLREQLQDFFNDGSQEARDHAEDAGNHIAALGSVPTVEPARIRQATDAEGMLKAALALEEDALHAWERALDASDAADPGYRFWLEDQIAEEQTHVNDLRKMTRDVSFADADVTSGASKSG